MKKPTTEELIADVLAIHFEVQRRLQDKRYRVTPLGSGTIWGFYPHRCHVESELLVSPGMTLSLSLHLPGAPGIRIERSLVTWSRPSEFGMQFVHDPSTGHHERRTL